MKIALSFPACYRRAGVERVLLETANFLVRRGHEVHVLAHEFDTHALDPHVIRDFVPTITRAPLLQMLSYARRCPAMLRDINADACGTFGVICPPGGVLNVQSVHAAWLETSKRSRNWKGRLRQKCNPIHSFLLAMERRHFEERRYRKLTAPTQQVKADLMRIYGVCDTDVVIIPNGYCEQTFNASRCESIRPLMRKRLGFKADDFVVVFAGNELERKGFGPLLRAVAILKNPRIHLLAVVGRVNVASYQTEMRRLGLQQRVHFMGAKNDPAPYYAAGDVMALPTQYEAWGLVIVEALACGTPVLTSRLAGAATTVAEGRNGELLENPLDVMEIASKLDLLASRSACFGRQAISKTVAHLTWEQVLKPYETVLISA